MILDEDRLKRIRESDMRRILGTAKPRRCGCGGQMVPVLIQHVFKYQSTASGGYRLHYCCQKCRNAAVFMSPLYLAQALWGFLGAGSALSLGLFYLPKLGPPPRFQDLLWPLLALLLVVTLFIIFTRGLFIELRNRLRYPTLKL